MGRAKGGGTEEGRCVGLSRRCGSDEKTEDVNRGLGGQPKFAWRVGQHFVLLFRIRIYILMGVNEYRDAKLPRVNSPRVILLI
jgi:hypothetical protein